MNDSMGRVGRRLVDLIGELEQRLTGAPGPFRLSDDLSSRIPPAATYVLVVVDGLGHHQLGHRRAQTLAAAESGVLDAPFPTTTTVSLATLATGMLPSENGVLGHLMWLDEAAGVVNVLKWVRPSGEHVPFDYPAFLPAPNLWERLRAHGVEPITVQPRWFERSPLTQVLYRGCRFEGASSVDEAVEATIALAATPDRLVVTYFPQVDIAAHMSGQASAEYATALGEVDAAWSRLEARIPPGVVVVGTADHGHIDFDEASKILIRDPEYRDLTFFGDARSLFVNGDRALIGRLAAAVGAAPTWTHDSDPWPGEGHPDLATRKPDAILAAPANTVLLPPGFDKRLIGYHGGLDRREVEIPLLVGE